MPPQIWVSLQLVVTVLVVVVALMTAVYVAEYEAVSVTPQPCADAREAAPATAMTEYFIFDAILLCARRM